MELFLVRNFLCSNRIRSDLRSFFRYVFSRIRTEYGDLFRVDLRIQSEYGKIRTRKNSDLDTFYAVSQTIISGKMLRNNFFYNTKPSLNTSLLLHNLITNNNQKLRYDF